MRIGYNLFLWHILGRIKNCCFRRKMPSLVFFPSLGQISFLLCCMAPALFSPTLPAVYLGKETEDWLCWVWDPSGADGKLRQLLHNSCPGEVPRAFPCGCEQEGTAQHDCCGLIRHNRFVLPSSRREGSAEQCCS